METFIAVMIAQILDPVRIVLVGLVVWGAYKLMENKLARWSVIAVGSLAVAFLIAAMLNRPTFIPGFFSGLVIAGVIATIVRGFVRRPSSKV